MSEMDSRARMAVEALSRPRRWLMCPCANSRRREETESCMEHGCEVFRHARRHGVDPEKVVVEDGGG